MSEVDRQSELDAWLAYAIASTGEAITDVQTALRNATGLTRERLMRAESALREAAAHLDTVYPETGAHSVKA